MPPIFVPISNTPLRNQTSRGGSFSALCRFHTRPSHQRTEFVCVAWLMLLARCELCHAVASLPGVRKESEGKGCLHSLEECGTV